MVRHTQILQTYTGEVYDFSAEFDPYVIDINNRLLDVETYKDRVQRNENFINSYDSRLNTLEAWKTIYPSVVNEQFDRAYDYIRETYWCRTDFLGFSYDMSKGNFIEGHKNNNLIAGSTSKYNHAEGFANRINFSVCTHVEGFENINTPYASYSHIEGGSNINQGTYSHIEGAYNSSSGKFSHIEGSNNVIDAAYSHIEGLYNKTLKGATHTPFAKFAGIHIEGYENTVTTNSIQPTWGNFSHIEGAYNTVYGNLEHIEGQHNTALGNLAHLEGQYNIAKGDCSHVSGEYNIANSKQIVLGRYNNEIGTTGYIIIGNGTSATSRKNMVEIDVYGLSGYPSNIYINTPVNINAKTTIGELAVIGNATANEATIGGNVKLNNAGIETPMVVAHNNVKSKQFEAGKTVLSESNLLVASPNSTLITNITNEFVKSFEIKSCNVNATNVVCDTITNSSIIKTNELESKAHISKEFTTLYSNIESTYTTVLPKDKGITTISVNIDAIKELFNKDILIGCDTQNITHLDESISFKTLGAIIAPDRESNFAGKLNLFPGIYTGTVGENNSKFDYTKLLLLLIDYVNHLNSQNIDLIDQLAKLQMKIDRKESEYNNRIALLESEVFDSFVTDEGIIVPISKNNGKIAFIE